MLFNFENEEVLTTINAVKIFSGKARLPQRVLLMREGKSQWRHMVLRKNEFVGSLTLLKGTLALVANGDDSSFWLK